MKKIIMMLVLAVAMMGGAVANAQEKSAEYEKLLDEVVTMQIKEMGMEKTFEDSFRPFVAQGVLPEASLPLLAKDMTEFITPITISMQKSLWREAFSLDDLKAIQQWMNTPVGKKMLEITSKATTAGTQLLQDPKYMEGIQKIVKKYIK